MRGKLTGIACAPYFRISSIACVTRLPALALQ
jgi:hypothetical protein